MANGIFTSSRRRGFTLVELLVVIGIIAVLIGILIPVVGRARESAVSIKCQGNLRQLMMAQLMFAAEHRGHLTGNQNDVMRPNREETDWMFGQSFKLEDAPQEGTLFPYTNRSPGVYRCPGRPNVILGSSAPDASNGHFDYTLFKIFAGALTKNIPPMARFVFLTRDEVRPTPVIVEEEPIFINQQRVDAGYSNFDRLYTHHRGGGHYASIDGSVHFFRRKLDAKLDDDAQPDTIATAWNWIVRAPSGRELPMGEYLQSYGWFNGQ